jgi:hypothetical protein
MAVGKEGSVTELTSSWWECGDREDRREFERWLEDK